MVTLAPQVIDVVPRCSARDIRNAKYNPFFEGLHLPSVENFATQASAHRTVSLHSYFRLTLRAKAS